METNETEHKNNDNGINSEENNNVNSNCGLTKEEAIEFDNLSKQHEKGILMFHNPDLEYMVSTGIIKISQAICDFDVRENYAIDERQHVQKLLFYRLKLIVDVVCKIGLSYHRSLYEV